MKQNKLLILSLLASFLLLTLTSYAHAANSVTFGSLDVCPTPQGGKILVPVVVSNEIDLVAMDIIGQIVSTSGGVNLKVSGITFDDRMALPEVLDERYPIGDLGGGIFRLGAARVYETGLLPGNGQIATMELEFLSDCVRGSAVLDPGTYEDKTTVFLDGEANEIFPTVTSGVVNVVNADPQFTNCPTTGYTIYWRAGEWGTNSVTVDLNADDPDLSCGCDALTFSKEGIGSINAVSGVYTFTAGPGDIGCHHVVVTVEDEYDGVATCEFDITVLNNPPEFTECPSETINILWGQTAVAATEAVDPDLGPSALTYTLESYDGPVSSTPDVDPISGDVTWVTGETNDFLGDFHICVKVTDGAPSTVECPIENSDVCCFMVHVEPKFRVIIEKIEEVYLGHYVDLDVYLDGSYETMEMGGFDFLITYDASILSFIGAEAGALLNTCKWEYFTYRHGYDGNCGTGCPSGALRLVALAETNNGPYHPSCFTSASGTQLATLTFFVINNNTFEGLYAPVEFFWMDCGDNSISSKYGDTLFLEDRVFNLEGDDITDHGGFPNHYGTSDECLFGDTKGFPLRAIDFKNGGVDIIPNKDIDDRGDINMNGLTYEIADAVMFTNYFIAGPSAFGTHVEGSIAASDVNADGATLTVADLVYLIRVIQGDAAPYYKPDPNSMFSAITQTIGGTMNVGVETSTEAGAALFVFTYEGEVGEPVLAEGVTMDLLYGTNAGELRVLVYNIGSNAIHSGDLMSIPVNGSMELRQVEAADFNGNTMNVSKRELPSTFALAQNYPNPFNPTTTIDVSLPVTSDYTLDIYNIAGQKIRTFSGNASAGVLQIVWDGKDASGSSVASGVYFYKVNAAQFSATKRMVMLK